MTNEELVDLIQNGERDRLPELWDQVERFVAVQAHKRLVLSAGLGGVEFGDLFNAGYLALVAAADSFNPLAGCAFIGWLALALKTAFSEAGGYRSRKQARDPLHRASSMDAPIGGDDDGDSTVGEFQADPTAVQALEDVERRLYLDQLHDALERALATLPAQQSGTLRRRYYRGQTLDEIAAADGVYKETVRQWQKKGLRALRRDWKKLAQFVEDRTPYYCNWSAQSGERTTEMITLRREELAERWIYRQP